MSSHTPKKRRKVPSRQSVGKSSPKRSRPDSGQQDLPLNWQQAPKLKSGTVAAIPKRAPAPRGEKKFFRGFIMSVLALILAGVAAYFIFRLTRHPEVNAIIPSLPVFHRDDFISFHLKPSSSAQEKEWDKNPPSVSISDIAGQPLKGIGGLSNPYMYKDRQSGFWSGIFPCPWNQAPGRYILELAPAPTAKPGTKSVPVRAEISIQAGTPKQLPPRFAALTLEYAGWYGGIKVKMPTGEVRDWHGLSEWARYLGTDALWILVGKTSGEKGRIWDPVDFETIKKIGDDCHRHGIKFGVWVMSYLTQPVSEQWLSRYKWALGVSETGVERVRAVSLSDPTRPSDIAELLSKFAAMPEVDYLGLDYIRNALGGYELAEEFYREMPWLPKPKGWDKMGPDMKIRVFASLKISRKDKGLVDSWQWWRAHRVAKIVRSIKSKIGTDKKLWCFTLGWQKGWQHGQDPVMFNDAGADADAIMLYEADAGQFSAMMKDWSSYVRHEDTPLMVGDIIDSPLHQGAGSRDFADRMKRAYSGIYGDGYARGIFIHDLSRLMHGRLGTEGTAIWAETAREIVRSFKASAPAAGAAVSRRAGLARHGAVIPASKHVVISSGTARHAAVKTRAWKKKAMTRHSPSVSADKAAAPSDVPDSSITSSTGI